MWKWANQLTWPINNAHLFFSRMEGSITKTNSLAVLRTSFRVLILRWCLYKNVFHVHRPFLYPSTPTYLPRDLGYFYTLIQIQIIVLGKLQSMWSNMCFRHAMIEWRPCCSLAFLCGVTHAGLSRLRATPRRLWKHRALSFNDRVSFCRFSYIKFRTRYPSAGSCPRWHCQLILLRQRPFLSLLLQSYARLMSPCQLSTTPWFIGMSRAHQDIFNSFVAQSI